MASLGLSQEELKAIEQTRQRLFQLSKGIESLKVDMLSSNPLPPASSLQNSAQILQKSMQSLLNIVSENADLFQRLAIHPSPNFPGRTQEGVLLQLIRKKLEPDVEERFGQGRDTAAEVTPEGVQELELLWTQLRKWVKDRVKTYVVEEANKLFTSEERAMGVRNVRTGLVKRNLAEEDDEDEDEDESGEDDASDEDEDEDVVMLDSRPTGQQPGAAAVGGGAPPPPTPSGFEPELLFWYADVGDADIPRMVEYESRKKVNQGGIPGMGK